MKLPLTFAEYQSQAATTAVYPEVGTGSLLEVMYCARGLAGEAGEVANKVKKLQRDGDSLEKRKALAKELSDCLWYAAQLASVLDEDLGELAQNNLDNLAGRKQRGTLHGDGDNR